MTFRWLGIALFAEGPTDHRFLDEFLPRAVASALADIGGHAASLSPVARLVPSKESSRAARIADGAEQIQAAFHLLFIHADADGDASAALSQRVTPGVEAVREAIGDDDRACVPVVPIQAIEAWSMADYQGLAETLGTTKSPAALGLPSNPADLESESDPKRLLDDVVREARGGRRGRRQRRGADYLDSLGQCVNVDSIRALESGQTFYDDLTVALDHLNFR